MEKHIPVLLNEVLDNLNIRDNKIYVDMTLGGAGHSFEILKRIPNGFLYGFTHETLKKLWQEFGGENKGKGLHIRNA